ncbi:MAG TPA: hypothetical protein VFS17_03435 [Methylophilaceae bacterium]|nr:hypothetical protein [Methylophilaceae bacterium]
MSKLMTVLFAGALFGSSCVVLAAEAQPMDESTYPTRGTGTPTENMQQKPDATGDTDSSATNRHNRARTYRGTNNPNSNSDVSGADQIERGSAGSRGKVEKLRQKPNPDTDSNSGY